VHGFCLLACVVFSSIGALNLAAHDAVLSIWFKSVILGLIESLFVSQIIFIGMKTMWSIRRALPTQQYQNEETLNLMKTNSLYQMSIQSSSRYLSTDILNPRTEFLRTELQGV
jgi:large-conductance mechanosensitive channel